MQKFVKICAVNPAVICLLALTLALPLTACHTLKLASSDPHNECAHPAKPEKTAVDDNEKPAYPDGAAGDFIVEQGAAIDRCRALLGHEVAE